MGKFGRFASFAIIVIWGFSICLSWKPRSTLLTGNNELPQTFCNAESSYDFTSPQTIVYRYIKDLL